jgi:hypothetical protein
MFSGKAKFGDGAMTQNATYFCPDEHVDRLNQGQSHKAVLVRTAMQ